MTTVIGFGYPVPVTARDRIVRSAATLTFASAASTASACARSSPTPTAPRVPPALLPRREDATRHRGPQPRRRRDPRPRRIGAPQSHHARRRDRRDLRSLALRARRKQLHHRDTPIAATIVDASADDRLRAEARTLFDRWRDAVRTALVQFGARESTAQDDASRAPRRARRRPHLEPGTPEHAAARHGPAVLHQHL